MSALTLHEQLARESLDRKQAVPAVVVGELLSMLVAQRVEIDQLEGQLRDRTAECNALREHLALIALAVTPKVRE